MAQIDTPQASKVPFLIKYASRRTPASEIQGFYSAEMSMWVVIKNGVETPLIDHATEVVELITKTNAGREADDEAFSLAVAELSTKTDSGTEQDDAGTFAGLEMATKTEAQMEHDDTSPEVMGGFL